MLLHAGVCVRLPFFCAVVTHHGILLCCSHSSAIDMWSVGCIFAELLARTPLFPGEDYIAQLRLICDKLGRPSDKELDFVTSERARRYAYNAPCASDPLTLALTATSVQVYELAAEQAAAQLPGDVPGAQGREGRAEPAEAHAGDSPQEAHHRGAGAVSVLRAA
jgi:serine/threonine protein kinase